MSFNLQGLKMQFLHKAKSKIIDEKKKPRFHSTCPPSCAAKTSTTIKEKTVAGFKFLVAANRKLYWDVDGEYLEYMSD